MFHVKRETYCELNGFSARSFRFRSVRACSVQPNRSTWNVPDRRWRIALFHVERLPGAASNGFASRSFIDRLVSIHSGGTRDASGAHKQQAAY
jgi:hypothetical protein